MLVNSAKADNRRRKEFYKNSKRFFFFKYILKNKSIPEPISLYYKNLYSSNFFVRIRNRCVVTGRGRAVYKFCKLSRGVLQEKAHSGDLTGFSKSSW